MNDEEREASDMGFNVVLATGMAWFGTSCNRIRYRKEKAGVALALMLNKSYTIYRLQSDPGFGPRLKSGGDPLETEEAIWLIEAAINYAYANNLEKGDF
jgi:hypothetical protein